MTGNRQQYSESGVRVELLAEQQEVARADRADDGSDRERDRRFTNPQTSPPAPSATRNAGGEPGRYPDPEAEHEHRERQHRWSRSSRKSAGTYRSGHQPHGRPRCLPLSPSRVAHRQRPEYTCDHRRDGPTLRPVRSVVRPRGPARTRRRRLGTRPDRRFRGVAVEGVPAVPHEVDVRHRRDHVEVRDDEAATRSGDVPNEQRGRHKSVDVPRQHDRFGADREDTDIQRHHDHQSRERIDAGPQLVARSAVVGRRFHPLRRRGVGTPDVRPVTDPGEAEPGRLPGRE